MSNQRDMFDNIGGRIVPKDVCERKHGGNPQSMAAFQTIKEYLTLGQAKVLILLRGSTGHTVDELCQLLNTTPNAISGRITELKMKGRIEQHGTRKTRSGCAAAVWKVTEPESRLADP